MMDLSSAWAYCFVLSTTTSVTDTNDCNLVAEGAQITAADTKTECFQSQRSCLTILRCSIRPLCLISDEVVPTVIRQGP